MCKLALPGLDRLPIQPMHSIRLIRFLTTSSVKYRLSIECSSSRSPRLKKTLPLKPQAEKGPPFKALG